MTEFPQTVQKALIDGDLAGVKAAVMALSVGKTAGGASVVTDLLGKVDCVRYTQNGIAFLPADLEVRDLAPDEVLILPTSVSLCGTDVDLIKKAQAGQLPPESVGKVVGHEAAGLVVGVGSGVKNWQIGQMVCLDSHFSCSLNGHQTFADCVASGKSCDGIVGGIRGSLTADGVHRADPRNGYWARLIVAPVSALPVELPLEVAVNLAAPSTLESLGNIYMIIGQLQTAKLLSDPGHTLCVVSGLGATGYPMAAVARHYKMKVMGINPSPGKRQFAEKTGACEATFASTKELDAVVQPLIHSGDITQVVVAVMVGDEGALNDALQFLEALPMEKLKRKACIAFGLFADAAKAMPMWPGEQGAGEGGVEKPMPQREFVFSRQHFTTPQKTEVYGVCGRDLQAWQTLMKDLQPGADGKAPHLVEMLNSAQLQVPGKDPLAAIASVLNAGAGNVKKLLDEHSALKLVANLLKGN